MRTDNFFDALEALLRKHLGDAWTWSYKDAYHPLCIYSEKLGTLWEADMDEEAEAHDK